MSTFQIIADRSSIVIEASSSVGPIVWEGAGLDGQFVVDVVDGHLDVDSVTPTGRIHVDLQALTSGNQVYDAELRKRINVRQFPSAQVDLLAASNGVSNIHSVAGTLTFHGEARPVSGSLEVEVRDDGLVSAIGHQTIDIRDFGIPAPTMLMLKIYPDVQVSIFLLAEPTD